VIKRCCEHYEGGNRDNSVAKAYRKAKHNGLLLICNLRHIDPAPSQGKVKRGLGQPNTPAKGAAKPSTQAVR
jgi:hypothetical protein